MIMGARRGSQLGVVRSSWKEKPRASAQSKKPSDGGLLCAERGRAKEGGELRLRERQRLQSNFNASGQSQAIERRHIKTLHGSDQLIR
jgi:hypothetical protein